MWKFLLPFAAFIALAVLFAFGLNPKRDIHALPSPLIGKAAPSIALTDVMDPARPVNNAEFKGQVYIVNVWGTWCGECRAKQNMCSASSGCKLRKYARPSVSPGLLQTRFPSRVPEQPSQLASL